MPLAAEIASQAHIAWVNRRLFTSRQLLRTLALPKAWWIDRDGRAPAPIAVCHYITFACPEACTFCNTTHAIEDHGATLSEAQLATLVDRLAPTVGTWAVGGGEPMAHPGIFEHYARIKHAGGRIFTVTSGTSLGPTRAKRLAEIAPDVIMFSLLGDEAGHDAAMGRTGAWTRTMGGLSNFLRARDPKKTTVLVNCAVSFENAHSMRAVVREARRLGADAVRFTWLSFLTASEAAAEAHLVNYLVVPDETLTGFDVDGMLAEADALSRENPGFVHFLPRLDRAERAAWYRPGGGVARQCHSLWHTLFLRPDGAVVPCGHLFDEPVGNVLTDNFDAVWNSDAMRRTRLDQSRAPFAVCQRCCKV